LAEEEAECKAETISICRLEKLAFLETVAGLQLVGDSSFHFFEFGFDFGTYFEWNQSAFLQS
jgi:hypothetical protein